MDSAQKSNWPAWKKWLVSQHPLSWWMSAVCTHMGRNRWAKVTQTCCNHSLRRGAIMVLQSSEFGAPLAAKIFHIFFGAPTSSTTCRTMNSRRVSAGLESGLLSLCLVSLFWRRSICYQSPPCVVVLSWDVVNFEASRLALKNEIFWHIIESLNLEKASSSRCMSNMQLKILKLHPPFFPFSIVDHHWSPFSYVKFFGRAAW